jgi:nitrate reductase cytochrome c-type subunit
MKKIILLLAIFFFSTAIFSQSNKASKQKSSVFAKSDNVSAEMIKNKFYLFITNKGAKKDTILLKSFGLDKLPLECKIEPFTTKGTTLHKITWLEKKTLQSKLKTEAAVTTVSIICELASKTKVLTNEQTTTKITEIHFLDDKQTVSETIDRIRNEGFECIVNKAGDVVLKNKAKENKMIYVPADKKFVFASAGPSKKK